MLRSRLLAALSLITASGLGLSACGGEGVDFCPDLHFPDGVTLRFQADAWAPGQWTVEVEELGCDIVLDATGDLDGTLRECRAGEEGVQSLLVLTDVDGGGLQLANLSWATPERLSIRLLHEGTVIFDEVVEPRYEIDEPFGRGCGERLHAELTLFIDGAGG